MAALDFRKKEKPSAQHSQEKKKTAASDSREIETAATSNSQAGIVCREAVGLPWEETVQT